MSSPEFTKVIVAPVEAINQEFTNLLLNYPELRTIKLAHPDYGSIQAELDSTQISIPDGTEYKINLHLRFKSGKIWHTTWGGDMNLANWCIVMELDLQDSGLDASAMYSPEHLFVSLSPTLLPKSRCEYNLEKSTFFTNGSRTTWAHLKYDVPAFHQGFRNFLESWTQMLRERGLHYCGKLLAVKPPIKKSSPLPEPTAKHYTWLTFRWGTSSGVVSIGAPQEQPPQIWRDYCGRISTAWPSRSAFVLLPTNGFVSPVYAVLSDLARLRLVPTTHPAFQEGLQFCSNKVDDGSGFTTIDEFGKAYKAAGKGVSSSVAPWDGAAVFGERKDAAEEETVSSHVAGRKVFKVDLAQYGLDQLPAKYVRGTSCRLEWRTVNGNIRARGTTKYHQNSQVESNVTKKQVIRTDDFTFQWEVKFQFLEKATVKDDSEQFLGVSVPQVSEHASSFTFASEHRITVQGTSGDASQYHSTDQSGPSRGVVEKAIGVLKYAVQNTLHKHDKAFNVFHSVGYFKPSAAPEDVFYIQDCLVNVLLPREHERYSDTMPTLDVTHADLISPTTPGHGHGTKAGRLRCNHNVSANSLRLSFSARTETSGPLRSIEIALHTDQLFGKNATFSVKPGRAGATSTNIRVVDTPTGAVSPALPLATPGEEDAWIFTVQGTKGVMELTDEDVLLSVEFLGTVLQGKHKVLITENAVDPNNVNVLKGQFTHPIMEIVV